MNIIMTISTECIYNNLPYAVIFNRVGIDWTHRLELYIESWEVCDDNAVAMTKVAALIYYYGLKYYRGITEGIAIRIKEHIPDNSDYITYIVEFYDVLDQYDLNDAPYSPLEHLYRRK